MAQLVKNYLQCGRPGFNTCVGKKCWRRERYPHQYSGMENSMDCRIHGVAKSWTQLSNFHFTMQLNTRKWTTQKSTHTIRENCGEGEFLISYSLYPTFIGFPSKELVILLALATQSCPILCNPMDHSLPGSSVHGISRARILEWVAISFSRESS